MIMIGYFLVGVVAGILGGAFGIGGGIVMVPAFMLLYKLPIHTAIGTSMLVIVPIAIAGAWRHWTLDNILVQIAWIAGLGGIVGAIIGASIVEHVPALYVKRIFALFLVYSAVRLWLSK
ncbi:MAG: sulfite exporter TauE/SafE family protein [candidate division KSB1 bacterium]|nr:sulfite exporter TauE/SafE family protein [candidate division KSB1 bacterium]